MSLWCVFDDSTSILIVRPPLPALKSTLIRLYWRAFSLRHFAGSVGFCAVFFLKTPKYKQKILRTLRLSTQIRGIFGATDLIRTGDLLITSELLYQLSHSSTLHICCNRQYFTIFLRHCQGRISCKRGKLLQGVSQKVIAF